MKGETVLIIDLAKLKKLFAGILAIALIAAMIPTANAIMTAANIGGIKLPILMYHHIIDNRKKLNKYTVSSDEFESDLQYIEQQGYKTVSVSDLIRFCESGAALPKKPIMITFDDGYESVYVNAYPLLKKHGMKAVINVIGKYADIYSNCDDHSISYSHITWDQLREMTKSGVFEVGNHTYDLHKNGKRKGIGKISGESAEHYGNAITADLTEMQNRAEQMLGSRPASFAYPFGQISKGALPLIKQCGFKAVFCCWERVNTLSGDSEELYHLNRFNRPHGTATEKFFSAIEKQM